MPYTLSDADVAARVNVARMRVTAWVSLLLVLDAHVDAHDQEDDQDRGEAESPSRAYASKAIVIIQSKVRGGRETVNMRPRGVVDSMTAL